MRTELVRQLRGDEETRACVYLDSEGYWTIATGRLVDARKKGAGLRPEEMTFLLNNDIDDRIDALTRNLPWFQNLDDARRGVLLNMAFQLGVEGLLGFEHTLPLIRDGKYENAAHAMLQSKWSQQTPARAQRLAEQMRTGLWQYAPGS
jgi:lysozyme